MRVLLKISWEALSGKEEKWLDFEVLDDVCEMIKNLCLHNIEVWIVVWAWNFIRWAEIEKLQIDRPVADNMWMLATNINSLVLSDILAKKDIKSRVINSFSIDWIAERFNKWNALKDFSEWKVVIFWGWTWNPYFTTDTAGVLRALEIEADLMIKATKVNWVYDKDPMKFHDAILLEKLTYNEVLQKNLRVMDFTAIALAKENNLKLIVCNLSEKWAILNCTLDWSCWTTIS